MQAALLISATVGIVAVAGAIVALVCGLLRELRKIGAAAEDLSHLLRTTKEEIAGVTQEMRKMVGDMDRAAAGVANATERVDRLTGGIEHILEKMCSALAAADVWRKSSASVLSIYEGVKQGMKSLCVSQPGSRRNA